MINVKKEVKKEDIVYNFLGESYNNHTKHVDKLIIDGKITYTTARMCVLLFNYFSSETGRSVGYKLYSISDLREALKINNKLASRQTISNCIKEIKENNIFLFDEIENKKFREKQIAFYTKSQSSIEKFEKVRNELATFSTKITHNYTENNVIFLEKSYVKNDKNITPRVKSNAHQCQIKLTPVSNQINTSVKSNVHERNAETIKNTTISEIENLPQETLYKETLYKETFIKEDFLDNKEIEKTKKETSLLEHIENKISVKKENENISFDEKEKVIQDLKNFGINSNIENLFKFNSIAEIKKQLEYHSFRENKTPGILYNAIKNKETAPAEYLNYLEIKKNDSYLLSGFYKLQCDIGAGIERTFKYNQKNLVTTLLYKLNNFGHLETNNPIENTENRFKQSDKMYLDTLINPLLKLFSKYKVSELMEHIKQGKETLFNTISLRREEIAVKELFTKKGIDLFKIEKSLNKINSMQSNEVI